MPSSDSEDFESADEGSVEKNERKKRLSSSNYSDNLGSEHDQKKTVVLNPHGDMKSAEGWDDFDIDENETMITETAVSQKNIPSYQESNKSKDDFDDWGVDKNVNMQNETSQKTNTDKDIAEATTSTKPAAGGWGWGWNVDSLLSSATAGISTITSQVSQGITTVLETGIGAPDPEELAKQATNDKEPKPKTPEDNVSAEKDTTDETQFQFGSLISGVTKFVGSTGTKVLAGGLDTLETIGKKTMEVLQDGDPGLAKKRAMLGLDPGDKPVLSQVLREAKVKADEEDRIREEKREAKEVHYESLFDDFEGLVHLEALEMLSRQATLRIEERMRNVSTEKRQDIKETLQQVAELCEMPEEDEDEEPSDSGVSKPDAFLERLQNATEDLGIKLHFQPLVTQYTEILDWLSQESLKEKEVYKRAISSVAQATALSVELYHKAAEMLLVKSRRSTADESDALTQMTVVLSKHISELATAFTEKLNGVAENKEQVNNYITNIFLEAGNSSTYIQNAFQLELPILQVGAV